MKKIFIVIFFNLFILGSTLAQDTLFFKNNKTEIVKVIEISRYEIKYKKFTYLDGPTIVVSRDEVRKIVYQNGDIERISSEVIRQDSLFFRSKNVEVATIIETNRSTIKYKRLSNPDGPTFIVHREDIERIVYQDGKKEQIANKKLSPKLYNPSANILLYNFVSSGNNSDAFFGLGHDGIFNIIQSSSRFSLGLLYSLNGYYCDYGGSMQNWDYNNNYYNYSQTKYEYYTFTNPYGLQIEFGKDIFKMYFQFSMGPGYIIYDSQVSNYKKEQWFLEKQFCFGFKVYKAKFGFNFFNESDGNKSRLEYLNDEVSVYFKAGWEF